MAQVLVVYTSAAPSHLSLVEFFPACVFSGLAMDVGKCAQLGKADVVQDKAFLDIFRDFDLGLARNSDFPFRIYILESRGPRGEKLLTSF